MVDNMSTIVCLLLISLLTITASGSEHSVQCPCMDRRLCHWNYYYGPFLAKCDPMDSDKVRCCQNGPIPINSETETEREKASKCHCIGKFNTSLWHIYGTQENDVHYFSNILANCGPDRVQVCLGGTDFPHCPCVMRPLCKFVPFWEGKAHVQLYGESARCRWPGYVRCCDQESFQRFRVENKPSHRRPDRVKREARSLSAFGSDGTVGDGSFQTLPCVEKIRCAVQYGTHPLDIARFGTLTHCDNLLVVRCVAYVNHEGVFIDHRNNVYTQGKAFNIQHILKQQGTASTEFVPPGTMVTPEQHHSDHPAPHAEEDERASAARKIYTIFDSVQDLTQTLLNSTTQDFTVVTYTDNYRPIVQTTFTRSDFLKILDSLSKVKFST